MAIILEATLKIPVGQLTDYKNLLKSLTVTNPEYTQASRFSQGFGRNNLPPKELKFYGLDPKTKSIILPRNIDPKQYSGTIVDLRSAGHEISEGRLKSFSLRGYQKDYMDNQVMPLVDLGETDIMLIAPCGHGKTIMGLYLASIYRRTSLVGVTTRKIGDQWISAVKDLFPSWSIGWYNPSKVMYDEQDKPIFDITIATYALLSDDTYGKEFYANFGHVLLDEYHRTGAATYHKVLEKSVSKYRTTLTATPRRKDNLHKILTYHAGPSVVMENQFGSATVIPITTDFSINEDDYRVIVRRSTGSEGIEVYQEMCVKKNSKEVARGMVEQVTKKTQHFKDGSEVEYQEVTILNSSTHKKETYSTIDHKFHKLRGLNVASVDSVIAEDIERTNIIYDIIRWCHSENRTVLVLAKRKSILFYLANKLKRMGIPCAIVASDKAKDYIQYCKKEGRTPKENEEYATNEADVVLGIDKIAAEGMDIPRLDTIIYTNAIDDIEQSIGRILRKVEGKKHPLAFYCIDSIGVYSNTFYNNKKGASKMFKELGHEVLQEQTIENFILNGNLHS